MNCRINKPGGCAKITKINYNGNIIDSLDVKYTVGGGSEKQLDPSIVSMYELYETPKCLWMILELVEGGDLSKHLSEATKYSPTGR